MEILDSQKIHFGFIKRKQSPPKVLHFKSCTSIEFQLLELRNVHQQDGAIVFPQVKWVGFRVVDIQGT